jgi:carbonic anhydrase
MKNTNKKPVWIGCSDSRVPETTLLGLQPGDVFVHRNIANIVSPTDVNLMAVVEYAVVHLKVKHIVLCGHTCCGGAGAALTNSRIGGVLDTWLTPLKTVRKQHEAELKDIADDAKRAVRLAELNVANGVQVLLSSIVVEEAVLERGLRVHGVLYDIASGRISELGVGNSGSPSVEANAKLIKGKHAMLVFGSDGANMAIR